MKHTHKKRRLGDRMISITEFFRKEKSCRGTTGAPGKPADGGNKKKDAVVRRSPSLWVA